MNPYCRTTLMLSILLKTVFSYGQDVGGNHNFIPNGSFEEARSCQFIHTTPSDPIKAEHWFSPSQATPDLFNQCAYGEMAVPSNYVGKAYPPEGNNYAGLFFGYVGSSGAKSQYREYLMCQLLDSLIKDTTYHYSFFAKPATKSNYLNKYLTFAFSNTEMHFTHDTLITGLSYFKIDTDTLTVENGWYKISGSFKATGGESYLVIGDFLQSTETEYREMLTAKYDQGKRVSSFYLFDNFKLFKPEIPVAYPIAELFTLDSIFFAFDSYQISSKNREELDLLIAYLLKHEQLQLSIIGNTDEIGTAAYNEDLSLRRATAVKEYMVENGVSANRLTLLAKGERELASTEDALNRRTAFILRKN